MATTKVETTIKKGLDTIKETTVNLNAKAVNFADSVVEETLATGQEWQDVMAKAMETGTNIFGKQQELVLDTLEALKVQYLKGTKRFGKLFSINEIKETIEDIKEGIVEEVTEAKEDLEADAKLVLAQAKAKVKVATTKVEKVKTKATAAATKKTTKATKTVKAAAKKTTKAATTATKATTAVIITDLKVIEGVGPKLESILKEAGIKDLKAVATAGEDKLKEILANAGNRYKAFDPKTWATQANLAAAGKMTELKALQAELKGGKV